MPPKHGEMSPEHVHIVAPDLLEAKYLNSKHTTPAESLEASVIGEPQKS